MSCNNNVAPFVTRNEYEKNMTTSYHSPIWGNNLLTRTKFDLDLQTATNTTNQRDYQQPWANFSNVMETYAPLTGFRTQFDQDMSKDFNTYLNPNRNYQKPWDAFNNIMS